MVIDRGGSGDFKTVRNAISSAVVGDVIVLKPGVYREGEIVLDKSVSIVGDEGRVTIDGGGKTAFRINAKDCILSNLEIKNAKDVPGIVINTSKSRIERCTLKECSTGILFSGSAPTSSTDNHIFECVLENCTYGVRFLGGENNVLKDCVIHSSLGVEISGSQKCEISGSTFLGEKGIKVDNSTGSAFHNCTYLASNGIEIVGSQNVSIANNKLECVSFGIDLDESELCEIVNNTITGSMSYGLVLSDSKENLISENNLTECRVGLDLARSNENIVRGNLAQECKIGLRLKDSLENVLQSNQLIQNEIAGMYLEGSSSNRIEENYLAENGNGLFLKEYSEENLIEKNVVRKNQYGISLTESSQNKFQDNRIEENFYNLRIEGTPSTLGDDAYRQEMDESNLVDGKPICYLVGQKDFSVQECGFLALVNCNNVTAEGLTLSNNSAGLLLVNSTKCVIRNSSFVRDEVGLSMIESVNCKIVASNARNCSVGFGSISSEKCALEGCSAKGCQESGFDLESSSGIIMKNLNSTGNGQGISLLESASCQILRSDVFNNLNEGVRLMRSPKCILSENHVRENQWGIRLSSSEGNLLIKNDVKQNQDAGISLNQLTGATVTANTAHMNGDGIFLQAAEAVNIDGNNLSLNSRYGLRMSYSTNCKVTGCEFSGNGVSGASLVDCSGNILYHNCFTDNGNWMLPQNAIDNGENLWDGGQTLGGNYWSDHSVIGNPGSVPKKIASIGVDRYPFQDPMGWRR